MHAWVKISAEMAGEISIFLSLARFGCNEDGIGKLEENGMLVIILKVVPPRIVPSFDAKSAFGNSTSTILFVQIVPN